MNKFLVVFDTNVIVSALLTEETESNELKLMEYINLRIITPILFDIHFWHMRKCSLLLCTKLHICKEFCYIFLNIFKILVVQTVS